MKPTIEPTPRKIRKSGTGCLYQINDSLWEGSFYPRLPNGKRKKYNVYAETRERAEVKLSEMIERVKAEIVEEKQKMKEGAVKKSREKGRQGSSETMGLAFSVGRIKNDEKRKIRVQKQNRQGLFAKNGSIVENYSVFWQVSDGFFFCSKLL